MENHLAVLKNEEIRRTRHADEWWFVKDCVNMEGIFRIIQSIRTHRPEPYKQWLTKVGYERIQEFLDPESVSRHRRTDTTPGGAQTPGSRKITDHTAKIEIISSMLGEAATAEIARKLDTKGLEESSMAARIGGRITDDKI